MLRFNCIIICLIIPIITFNCSNNSNMYNDKGKLINIKPNENIDYVLMSSIADSVSYIKLETTEECLISQITKIIYFKTNYYIIDSRQNEILCFSSDGRFRNRFNKFGKGPGEYIKIEDAFINRKTESLEVFDKGQRKILIYDLNYNFIREIKLELVRDIIPIENGNYLCYNYNDDSKYTRTGLWEIDSNGKFTNHYFKSDKYYKILTDWNVFYYYDNNIRVFARQNNNIYNICNDTVSNLYMYGFPDYRTITDIKVGKISDEDIDFFNISCLESSNWLISEWGVTATNKVLTTFYNKNTDELVSASGLVNDIDFIIGDITVPTNFTKNKIIKNISSVNFLKQIKEIANQVVVAPDLLQISKKMKPDDNPVLQIIYLK
jgi:hypothetical protein